MRGTDMAGSGSSLLSIDFGTTNSTAAYRDRSGATHEVRLGSMSNLMPTAVFADGSDLIVGDAAINNALTDPAAFEPNPKRQLRYTSTVLGKRNFSATSLVGAVLKHIVQVASTRHGGPFDRVVLTYPDGWRQELIGRLKTAAGEAGIRSDTLELLSESQAASAFYTGTQTLAPNSRICIFDFGAGTCDVTVLDCDQDSNFSVVASDGVEYLGGNDLDARLHSWVAQRLHERDPEAAAKLSQPATALTFNERIRDAKETLSTAARATIPLPDGSPLQITRSEFETLIAPDVDEAVALTNRVIARAQAINPRPISQIYLVGGSSHIPLVHRELGKIGRLATMGDPKTVVVQGALLHDNLRRQQRPRPASAPNSGGAGSLRGAGEYRATTPPPPPISPAPIPATPIPAPRMSAPPPSMPPSAPMSVPMSAPMPMGMMGAMGQYPPAPPKKSSSSLGMWLAAVAAVLIAVIVVAVVLSMNSNKKDDAAAATSSTGAETSAVSTSSSTTTASSTAVSSAASSSSGLAMPRRAGSSPAGTTGQDCGLTPFRYTPDKTAYEYVYLTVTTGRTSPTTTCGFAMAVAADAGKNPSSFPLTVQTRSDATGDVYSMDCRTQSNDPIVIRCSDGRNAEVYFYY
ncbi:MAG: Hsp70 family protein [Gordonia sp. (in: high G+C Gram-positive bacteria)]|uniref:Hsp70 family protein n=1 Tax=Gordonia sp. (in: high G+C Gram-positive bacteria) TaxID=84139 RepID=UPI003BB69FA2